ncbi:MAG: sigma-54-dependent Fis family transcriptional regulator [Deltaproteobacteria bacterium]|nr:sigma-54-dependent Fis family transcriptional regulator [Deltaproteobacteria bacterium]
MSQRRILIVDDEERLRSVLEKILARLNVTCLHAESGEDALKVLEGRQVDLILTDLIMPGMGGVELLRRLRQQGNESPVIIITAHGSIESAVQAVKEGASDYIEKPFDKEKIALSVEKALQFGELLSDFRALRDEVRERFDFSNIVTRSEKMLATLKLASKVAGESQTTVLITGESGTGKELMARAIHYNSDRRQKRFVAVNCTAIPDTLLESELFGYEKGAFTGADRTKPGLLEQAGGGTLFLDEIGDMSLPVQAKMLRVLQEREFTPVGSREVMPFTGRIVCATNRNLEQMVSQGEFREDLFYRINVFPVHIPPLRERKEDVILLGEFFLKKFASEMGKPLRGFTPEAARDLEEHPWKGNVRELGNLLERAVILAEGLNVTARDLNLRGAAEAVSTPVPAGFSLPVGGLNLEELERTLVEQAIQQARFNKTRAAQLLGLTRAQLRSRLEKFGIEG